MSTTPSTDAKAVVKAVAALTTQVGRIADTLTTPVVDGAAHRLEQERNAVALHRQGLISDRELNAVFAATDDGLTTPATTCSASAVTTFGPVGPCTLRVGHEGPVHKAGHSTFWRDEQAPSADEEQTLKWARRESLLVLITRLQRGRTLTEEEAGTLRHHIETEIRDADTARAVAAGNKRHVQTLVPALQRAEADANHNADQVADAVRRAESAERDLRTLRTGIRAAGGDPTQIQNLWAQLRLRNRQWAEAKREVRAVRSMLEEEGGDVRLVDEMLETVANAEARARDEHTESERLRDLLIAENKRANEAIDREGTVEQAAEEAQAAIERVRAHANDAKTRYAHGRNDYEIGKHDLACTVLGALDSTEQPTTEA